MATWDPRKDAWFAGFADGEACFVIARRTDRPAGVSVRFQLALRSDDLSVLEQLQAVFGGTLRVVPHAHGKPQAHWNVIAKRDLAELVRYFDRFPLRAKKARDYAIWRRAVSIVCSSGSGDLELPALVDALREVRAFQQVNVNVSRTVAPRDFELRLAR